MDKRYILLGATHFLCTALVLKILHCVLPCSLSSYYSCAAYFVMCTIVAKLTFGFTKKNFLSERIQPINKAVFITGCDSGFGLALAKRLDSAGFHVFASCLNPDGPGADDLRKSCSKRLQIPQIDVTKDDSVKRALEYVKDNLGTSELWAIVNNAGIQKGFSTELTSMQEFVETMEVNCFGMVRVTKAFLPLLRQSKGRVVNLTSLAGRLAFPHCCPYTLSKFAAVGFSECLRQEMDVWGVKVISIEPEFFQTTLTSHETVSKHIDETFRFVDEEVLLDYGEKYLKKFKLVFNLSLISSPEVQIVIDDLEKAVSLEHPDIVYQPTRNLIIKLLIIVVKSLPLIFEDVAKSLACYVVCFPEPTAVSQNW